MIDKIKNFIGESKTAQLLIALIIGVAIGAIFYPSRRIEETINNKHKEEITKLNTQHLKQIKQEQEKTARQQKMLREYKANSEKRISSLTTQITDLKTKKRADYYKIVHPDGTIEIKKHSESETEETQKVVTQIKEEFKQKIDEVEKRWEKSYTERLSTMKSAFAAKEQEYKKRIDELSSKRVEEVNRRSSSIAVGYLLTEDYYIQLSHDIFGPFFLSSQFQTGDPATFGLGLGLRF